MTMTIHTPRSEAEAAAIIRAARAAATPFEIFGGGSKRAVGHPVEAKAGLSSSGLSGITLHEPAELVIGARAGTPLAMLTAALDAKGQMLPFEPADYRMLLGTRGMVPTVGGMVATNLSGPRRIMSGACRDAMIGIRFVNGLGEVMQNGGRVMKNVTGYDLVKLLTGSWGSLGFITQATFKVLPKPESTVSLVWRRLADDKAVTLMSAALGSPFEVSAAAHLPQAGNEPARTFLRLENFTTSVAYRFDALARELKDFGAPEKLEGSASEALWRAVRDVAPLTAQEGAVWRISVAPSKAAGLAEVLAACRSAHFYDWGGGLLWLASPATEEAGTAIRLAAEQRGGHAALLRAPEMLRRSMGLFAAKSGPLGALTDKVRLAFDPAALFNPGRMDG